MIGFKHILCPTDLTPESDAALRYAVALAVRYEAKLTVCHCAEATSPDDEAARETFGKRVDFCVRRQPYREILSYAEENEIDLICMGVHGAGFAMRALFGSNTDRVLRQAPCPTLIARPLKPASVNNGWKNDLPRERTAG
jgi:nucleotide-binding universal stress UspA family protein